MDASEEPKQANRYPAPAAIGVMFALIFIAGLVFIFMLALPMRVTVESQQLAILPSAQPIPEKEYTIKKIVFGYSKKGRPIEGYEIGSGDRVLFLHGAIHGKEMGSAMLLRELVLEIAANPHILTPSKKLVIIPIVNPDGYYDRTDKLNANGVNLNLNFPTADWQTYGPEGTFAGTEPFSETESRVLRDVVAQYKPDTMIAYHSFGALVSPEMVTSSRELARWYAEKTGYTYYDIWDYPGTATKWFEESTEGAAITVELTKDLFSDWDINKEALRELIGSEALIPTVLQDSPEGSAAPSPAPHPYGF
ncbi:MAG: M14 family zinc carboxypeptidase [bacterium]|nr:M14 family zinc carboxypeptidase [bacterium]